MMSKNEQEASREGRETDQQQTERGTRLGSSDPNDEMWRRPNSESDTGYQDGTERGQKASKARSGKGKGGREKESGLRDRPS